MAQPTSRLKQRDKRFRDTLEFKAKPTFPKNIMVEVSNQCNQKCVFCSQKHMLRTPTFMSVDLFSRIVTEAYELGAREIGLTGGAEPLTNPHISKLISICKDMGYEYIYLSTNGTVGGMGSTLVYKSIIDSGLDSLKFSINAPDKETYELIHGVDMFNIVYNNLKFVNTYRTHLYLSVSFVECDLNKGLFPAFKELFSPLVDEIYYSKVANQSGQLMNYPVEESLQEGWCAIPFNQVNISAEGYLRGCCCDYDNLLAMEDLNKKSLEEAYYGVCATLFRGRHLKKKLDGLLCNRCLNGIDSKVIPIKEGRW